MQIFWALVFRTRMGRKEMSDVKKLGCEFVDHVSTWNSGGDLAIDVVILKSGQVLGITDESVVLYEDFTDLEQGDARATYKNLYMDFRNYKTLKMEIHAEEIESLTNKVAMASTVAEKLHADKQLMELQIRQELGAVNNLQSQRHELLRQMEVVKADVARQQELLDDRTKSQLTYRTRLADLQNELKEFNEELQISTYPNPFTTATTIEFTLDGNSKIQISIYNAMGELVYEVDESRMPPGTHQFSWSPHHLPSGIYYGVINSEEGVSVVKMVKR